MISIQNISKSFGRFAALKDISLTINKGEIVGFLGQNGAGKTTLMRILTGYLPATSGRVLIHGNDVAKNPLTVKSHIGYLPEVPPLYPQMTVWEFLVFAARLKGLSGKVLKSSLEKAMEECQLKEAGRKLIAHLSLGFRQRVGLAQAIIHDPQVLILDEPTKGLDPIQVRQVRTLIAGLKETRTVIVSTHVLSEIERLAQRVLMIKAGQIIADRPLATILKEHGGSLEQAFFKLNGNGEQ